MTARARRIAEFDESPLTAVPMDSDDHAPSDQPDLFRRWTMAELLDEPSEFSWVVRGLLVDPTYGQVAGEQKTLKTHLTSLLTVAVAAGVPFLDKWKVERPGPVVVYTGEGGRKPHRRLLERVARAMDVDLRTVPIHPTYDVAPITSARFTESLDRDLHELEPVLFNLDPYYAYHGAKTDSRNLHEEGGLLTSISTRCVNAGASCLITNHFNQTGNGGGLQRITQAGSGEWVDTWLLTSHRETPDVDGGRFWLRLEIGSRQWGGSKWDLDLNVGRFDPELGLHDGEIRWDLDRAHIAKDDTARDRLVAAVEADPGGHSKEALAKLAGGNLKAARQIVDGLEREGLIKPSLVTVTRSNGRRDKAWHFFPASDAGRAETQGELL